MKNTHPCEMGWGYDWRSYNIKLSNRAEIYLDFSWLDSWLTEIHSMNLNKVGQPYCYPESMIIFLGLLKAKGFSYRELKGMLQSIESRLGSFPIISFSQIRRRILKLDLSFPKLKRDQIIAIDGTGLKVTNRGEWIRHKWKIKRGWVKVVLAGNTEGDIIDLEIGDENFDERVSARRLIKKHMPREALLDGLHDTYDTYELCEKQGVLLRTPARAGSSPAGFHPRNKAVKKQLELGRDKWVKETKFGMRWVASEGIFSASKTIFGENLTSHKKENIMIEARLKFWAYQNLRNNMKT